ncbi:MAG: MlaC/ttg2D family ABC transporter substrate-binding protein [Pseudomonadota bacterium]
MAEQRGRSVGVARIGTEREVEMRRVRNGWFMAVALMAALLVATTAVAEPRPAHETLKEAADAIQEELAANEEHYAGDEEALHDLVDRKLVPLVDFEVASRWVLGRHARDASDDQLSEFQDEFQQMLMRFYSSALLEFDAWDLRFEEMRRDEGRPLGTVRAEAVPEDGSPVPVTFRVILRDGEWRVFDVSVEGISAVTNYRSNFGPIIRRDGLDALITRMGEWSADDDPVLQAAEKEREED